MGKIFSCLACNFHPHPRQQATSKLDKFEQEILRDDAWLLVLSKDAFLDGDVTQTRFGNPVSAPSQQSTSIQRKQEHVRRRDTE